MQFNISLIYDEGNVYVDRLANLDLTVSGFNWRNSIPIVIKEQFYRDRLGLPSYKFD